MKNVTLGGFVAGLLLSVVSAGAQSNNVADGFSVTWSPPVGPVDAFRVWSGTNTVPATNTIWLTNVWLPLTAFTNDMRGLIVPGVSNVIGVTALIKTGATTNAGVITTNWLESIMAFPTNRVPIVPAAPPGLKVSAYFAPNPTGPWTLDHEWTVYPTNQSKYWELVIR